MPPKSQLVYTDNPGAIPASYIVPPSLDLVVQSIVARFNGAAAAASFMPTLEVLSQDGRLIARVRPDQTFLVGDTGVVTWSPFLRRAPEIASTQTRITARIENTAGQSVPNATDTDRVFNLVSYDTNGMADLAADDRILTVQSAGTYLITSECNFVANATGRRITVIVINGFYAAGTGTRIAADSRMAITTAASRTTLLSVGQYQLSPGDTISAGVFQASGGALTEGGLGAYNVSALTATRLSA